MTNTPIQVTTDLSKALEQINLKLDKIDEKFAAKLDKIEDRLNTLEKGQARLEENVKSLTNQVGSIEQRVEKIDSLQRGLVTDIADLKGAKSLVIPIVVAVLTSLITLLVRAIPNP